MKTLIYELLAGEQGQDIIEYALLCAFIGITAIAAFNAMGGAIKATYSSWDSGTQNLAATTPDPR